MQVYNYKENVLLTPHLYLGLPSPSFEYVSKKVVYCWPSKPFQVPRQSQLAAKMIKILIISTTFYLLLLFLIFIFLLFAKMSQRPSPTPK